MYNPTKPYKHKILKLIESTWNTPYVKVSRGLYPIIEKKFSLSEIQHTDGIGTKGLYQCRIGDILVGLGSGGLHSNGFTKIREIFGTEYKKEFTASTKIYLEEILSLLGTCKINGMMHITGGAFTKLKDILGNADAIIFQPKALQPQKVFKDLYEKGLTNKTMYSTFNCGVGFILSMPEKEVVGALAGLAEAEVIGKVVRGSNRIQIISAFNSKTVKL